MNNYLAFFGALSMAKLSHVIPVSSHPLLQAMAPIYQYLTKY